MIPIIIPIIIPVTIPIIIPIIIPVTIPIIIPAMIPMDPMTILGPSHNVGHATAMFVHKFELDEYLGV